MKIICRNHRAERSRRLTNWGSIAHVQMAPWCLINLWPEAKVLDRIPLGGRLLAVGAERLMSDCTEICKAIIFSRCRDDGAFSLRLTSNIEFSAKSFHECPLSAYPTANACSQGCTMSGRASARDGYQDNELLKLCQKRSCGQGTRQSSTTTRTPRDFKSVRALLANSSNLGSFSPNRFLMYRNPPNLKQASAGNL